MIKASEKILMSCIPLARRKAQMQEQLEQHSFVCDGAVCVGPNATRHEKRQKDLFELDQMFAITQGRDTLTRDLLPSAAAQK